MRMSRNTHHCHLPQRDTSGFPRLPPNASFCQRLRRSFRKLSAINPSSNKCKRFFRNNSALVSEQRRHARSEYFYVIHPFSKLASVLELLFFVIWMFGIFYTPIDALVLEEDNYILDRIQIYFELPMKIMLITSFFFLGYVDHVNKQIIIAPKDIVRHYLTTYFFFDLIATELFLEIVHHHVKPNIKSEAIMTAYTLLTILLDFSCYYVRIGTLLDTLDGIGRFFHLPRELRFAIKHISRAFLFIHLSAWLLYIIPNLYYKNNVPESTWLHQAYIEIAKTDDSDSVAVYWQSLLMTLCYFLGASHGKYIISDPIDEICLSILTLFGRLYTLFMLADVLRWFGIATVSESRYEQRVSQLEEYMSSKNLPQNLRSRLLKYYEYKLQKRYFNEKEILSTLSEHLRMELFLFSARKLVQKAPVFKMLPRATLGVIIASMTSETYSPRDVIIKAESVTDEIYFISSGTVAVLNKDGLEMLHLEDGEEFGISVIENKQRYKHVAVETTEVFSINRLLFLEHIQSHSDGLKCFENTVKKRTARYERIEEYVKRGGADLLSELQSGNLLEHLVRKPTAEA